MSHSLLSSFSPFVKDPIATEQWNLLAGEPQELVNRDGMSAQACDGHTRSFVSIPDRPAD